MATNVNLGTRNCCQDFDNPYVYTFDHSQQALVVKNISNGSVVSSYPLDTYINEIYTSYFDGLFFWSIERVYSGFLIKRWILSSSILRKDKIFNFVTSNWLSCSSTCFSIIHNSTNLSSNMSIGDGFVKVDSTNNFSTGDSIYVGINENFGIYERFTITAIDEVGSYLYLDHNSIYGYSSGAAVVRLDKVWVYNDYCPYDDTEASILHLDPHDGILTSFHRTGMFKGLESASYDNSEARVIAINGHSLLYIDPDTNNITKIMYIDNLTQNRSDVIPTYAIFVKSSLLYRLQTYRVYYSGGAWQEEDWYPYYNFVTDPTTASVYFVELFSEENMIHKVSSPEVPTAISKVKVRVLTQYRVPVSGRSVSLSSSQGYLLPSSGSTDSNGELDSVYNGNSYEGNIDITATVI